MIELSPEKSVAIVGHGYVGQAYNKMFPDAVIYDEPRIIEQAKAEGQVQRIAIEAGRNAVNNCDMAIVAVPTELIRVKAKDFERVSWSALDDTKVETPDKINPPGRLDMSIVEDVVSWIDTPLILIKSALMPGTTDRLVKETGKNIAVSVEYVGRGGYYIPPDKYPDPNDPTMHQTIVVGGELETATACAEFLWNKMRPDLDINLVTALEAEITKLVENSYPALKVTFINTLYELAQKSNTNFIRLHQAWTADPRTEGMHLRTTSHSRGWDSHCWNKDIPALASYAKSIGAETMAKLFDTVIEINEEHKNIS